MLYTLHRTILIVFVLFLAKISFSQQTKPCVRAEKEYVIGDDAPHRDIKTYTKADKNGGVVYHNWYSTGSPQVAPYQVFTDEGTRQYFLTTYGIEVFQLFPDYPRWTVANPDITQIQEYKLKVAEWTDNNPRYNEFMERRKQELSTSRQ